jgi:hypothetical protein
MWIAPMLAQLQDQAPQPIFNRRLGTSCESETTLAPYRVVTHKWYGNLKLYFLKRALTELLTESHLSLDAENPLP